MSAALGKRTSGERADERLMAAYWSGVATEEQIADVADLLLSNYDRLTHCGRCGTFLVEREAGGRFPCVRCTSPRRPYPSSRQGSRSR